MSDIKKKISGLPLCPGVYIMKDKEGKVIYVGKSKLLKNRVSQYFQSSKNHSAKTRSMVEHIADFDYIITDTEAEALALECNLIKKHRPKYNILLKDDKQYPYIKITTTEDFPRIFMTRQLKKDGNRYFGPYMSAFTVREALEDIRRIFKIRSCTKKISENGPYSRPCLYYHIGRCSAPCGGKISKEDYGEAVKHIENVLGGNYKPIADELTKKMLAASEALEFEKAALYRDKLEGIKNLAEKQKISSAEGGSRDIIGIYNEGAEYCIQVFYYRGGKAVGAEHFTLESSENDSSFVLEETVKQFYFTAIEIPREILLSEEIEDSEGIAEWLSQKSGHKVSIAVPKRGEKKQVTDMVVKNAKELLYKKRFLQNKSEKRQNEIISQLTKLLNLPAAPFRIESYDISNISGANSVGVQIVYVNAIPQKSLYRKYNIKNVEGANDYESTTEVIFRRINEGYREEDLIKEGKLEEKDAKFLPFPDLILLDGGKGHVSAVRQLFDTMGEEIPVYGLVKDDSHRTRGICDENGEFPISHKSDLFKFLSCMQDEVHRFAISAHRKKHISKSIRSELENINGVGEETAKKLLKRFLSVKGIKNAGLEELTLVTNKRTAENIYEYFHGKEQE